jgi:hypothetical protein
MAGGVQRLLTKSLPQPAAARSRAGRPRRSTVYRWSPCLHPCSMSKLALRLSLCDDMLGSADRTNHRTKDSQRVIRITVRIKDTHRRRNQQMTQPPVDRESLQVLLARIHERLNEAGSVDAGSREMLGQVMGDIERALAQGTPPSVVTAPASATATADLSATGSTEANTSRLEALAVRFEADHPSLAATLRRLVDLLSEVGI